MKIQSKPYGEIEIDERQILSFPQGLFGFESQSAWALLDSTQYPFYWLQSILDPGLAFVLINPAVFRPDFRVELAESDRVLLQNPDEKDLLVFAIVTIPDDSASMTANLQGPLVINKPQRIACQVIQTNPQWKVRHRILDEISAAGAR